MKKNSVFATVIALMFTVFAASAMAETHIYISQAAGVNSSATAGTEANPFKSIAYGMMTMANRGTPDPWVVHIKAGTYDADTAKAANEREIFPITLRQGMTIQGDNGASRSGSPEQKEKNRSRTPLPLRREKRLYTVFQSPYSAGRGSHCAPLRMIQSTASINRRIFDSFPA